MSRNRSMACENHGDLEKRTGYRYLLLVVVMAITCYIIYIHRFHRRTGIFTPNLP